MDYKLFQDIFDLLQDVLPDNWKRLAVYAGYTEGSYSIKYYVDHGDGNYIDCFSLGNIDRAQLIQLFMDMNRVIVPCRNNLNAADKWTVLSMLVDFDGKMKTHLAYHDISEDPIKHEQEWKKQYLI